MPETVKQCPLCGGGGSLPFDRRKFHDQLVENRICRDCGLIFQSPRMTADETAAFYIAEYRQLQEGSSAPTKRNLIVQEGRAVALYDFTRAAVPSIARHLDIGCSTGSLLRYFKDHYHNKAVGVEPGEAHRARARELGLEVYATLDELEKAGGTGFDLVSMSHVLEHFPDPVGILSHLRESILSPEGWLLVEVPNLYAHDSFELAHLFAFSPHTLRETLRKSGFGILRFERHGRPSSQLLPLYLTALCQPVIPAHPVPVRREWGVPLKRRVGMLWRRILTRVFPQKAWLLQG